MVFEIASYPLAIILGTVSWLLRHYYFYCLSLKTLCRGFLTSFFPGL